MISKAQLATFTEALITASVVGIGWALGGTVGAAIMAGIGINLSSAIIQSGSKHLKDKWLSSHNGILNHDIQLALERAFVKTLNSLEHKYFELQEANVQSPEKKEAIRGLFKELREETQGVFVSSLGHVIDAPEIKEYLYGDAQNASDRLWRRVEGTKLIYTYYGEHFKEFLRTRLPGELVFWFGEELKNDNRECNKAWRAFQRMLLEGIQGDLKAVHANQELIRQDLQVLDGIRTQLDELKDTVDQRIAGEPFQQGLEESLKSMRGLLETVAGTAQRTEIMIDVVVATTDRTEAKLDTVVVVLSPKASPEIHKVPDDIQALFDEGWDFLQSGKNDDADAAFKRALEFAVERDDTFAVAEAKFNQAQVLVDFQRNSRAAKPLLLDCLQEYKKVNSESNVAAVLRLFGLIEIDNRDFDQAKSYTSQALEIYRELGKKTGIGDSLRQLGWIAHARGNLSQALDLYDQSLACSLELLHTGDSKRRKGEAQAIAACYAHMGMVYEAQGKIAEAESSLTQALEWERKSGFKSETAKVLLRLAELKCREGQFEVGIEYLNEAGNLYKEIGDSTWLARCLDLLARVHFTGGELEKATVLFEGALDAVEQSGDYREQELFLNKLGQLHLKAENLERAKEYFEKGRDLSLRENLLEGYAAALRCLADIAEIENKTDERNKLLSDGALALEKQLVATQREPKRASILGEIASFYGQMENFQQALVYFQRAKTAYELLGSVGGIANTLGGIAWAKHGLGKTNEEFDTYREMKRLVDGSAHYYLIAGAANNLADFERQSGNLDEAKRLLEEAEFYCRKYNLPLLDEVEKNQEILAAEFKKVQPPELDLNELISDLFSLIESYPESRDSLFRLWFFEKATDLYSNYRSTFGVKLMVCQDDVNTFLRTAKLFAPYADLCLQTVSSEFPKTIREQFEYPTERGFQPIFSIAAVPKNTPKDAELKIDFSKLKRRYIVFLGSELHSKTTGNKGCLVLGWSVGLPKQAHQLILSSTAADLLQQKVFFLPYERNLSKDRLLLDLQFSKDLGLIPIYFDALPSSENVTALHSAHISLPALSEHEAGSQRKNVRGIKRALTQLLSIAQPSALTTLNALVAQAEEQTDRSESSQIIQMRVYIFQFPTRLGTGLHVAVVIKDSGFPESVTGSKARG